MLRQTAAPAFRTVLLFAGLSVLAACGSKQERPAADLAASRVTTIGVNGYLWRASLDTLSFMPLLQTDSNGGVIVTEWYANPTVPNERMKLTVSILDQDLRADGLRVAAKIGRGSCRVRGFQYVSISVVAVPLTKKKKKKRTK